MKIHKANPGIFQSGQQLPVNCILALVQKPDLLQGRVNLLLGHHAGFGVPALFSQLNLIFQGADAHHEEFVQVALVDGGKAQPFAQRDIPPLRFFQHPLIEFQPGQFSIYITSFSFLGFHIRFLLYDGGLRYVASSVSQTQLPPKGGEFFHAVHA